MGCRLALSSINIVALVQTFYISFMSDASPNRFTTAGSRWSKKLLILVSSVAIPLFNGTVGIVDIVFLLFASQNLLIAVANHGDLGHGCSDFAEIGSGQLDVDRAIVFIQALDLA